MKKLCLFFLSIFMLMSMSWAGVRVAGKIAVKNGNQTETISGSEGAVTVKLFPATGDAIVGELKKGANDSVVFTDVAEGTYTLKVEGRTTTNRYFATADAGVSVTVGATDLKMDDLELAVSTTKIYLTVYVKDKKKADSYAGGENLVGATVKVWPKRETESETAPDNCVTATTAGSVYNAVAYVLLNYTAGAHMVQASADGYTTKTIEIERIANADNDGNVTGEYSQGATVKLDVNKGTLADLTVTVKEGSNTGFPTHEFNGKGTLHLTDHWNDVFDGEAVSGQIGKYKFTQVPVGKKVTFSIKANSNSVVCWGITTATAEQTIASGTTEYDVVLEKIAASVSGTAKKADGTVPYANVKASKEGKNNISAYPDQTTGAYTLYGLTAGDWTISAASSNPFLTATPITVTIDNNFTDLSDKNFTFNVGPGKLTVSLSASVGDYGNKTNMWGASVKVYKHGTTPTLIKDTVLPQKIEQGGYVTNSPQVIFEAMFNENDSVYAVYNHPDYDPVTVGTRATTYVDLSADNATWTPKTAPATLDAYRVDNALAVWESADATATPAVKAGVKLTWAYPQALLDNYANYSVQKIEIERIKYSENNAREVIAYWPKTGNLNDKDNLPTSYKDEAALENGYYGYKISIRYATPSATKDTTVVYGVMPLKVKDLTATYLKEGDKHTATITWAYPAELGTGFGTTYKLQRIELRRRDLSTAADVAVLAVDSIKKADGTAKAFAELLKTYKDEGLVDNGSYTYLVEIRYEKPVGTTTEYVVLDLAPVAPINAVAVWNNSTNKMDLSWGYPASLAANWATLQPQKLDIERKDLSSQAAPVSVYSYAVGRDDTYETLPREYSDATASKTGNYKYIFTLRFKDKPACSTEVSPAKRPHRAIDLDAVWTPASGSQGAGVKLTWSYPLELLQTLGTTYKMQHMSLERRDATTPADIITLAAWQKEQLATADALPRTFFDNTALSNGNYNYVITIRYEEPVATVETVKNLNMNLSGVQELAAAWTAAAGGKKAGMKLTWDYTADLRNGLGSAYKLEKLDIVRRDLSTAYDYTTVATYMFMTVSHTEEGGQTTTIDYMTDQSKLPVEFLDTLGATNTGNYSYLFTLRYASPKGQAEAKVVVDQREVVTLSYSVNDATLGVITGSPVSSTEGGVTYRKGDLITLKASVKEGADASARFVEWKNGDVRVSTEAEYAFNIMENTTLVAVFAKDAPAVEPLKLINTAATWNTATEKVDLSWDYPQAVKDGLGTTYKIQKIDIERVDAALGASSKTLVKYFTSFTTAANLPTKWEDGEVEKGKTYNYTFTIRYESPVGAPDTTVTVTIPGEQANEDVEAASWSVYSHNGVIEMNGVEGAYTYMVYDLNGRVVAKGQYNGNSHSVRVENKGMYIVRRVSVNGVSAKKVMVM